MPRIGEAYQATIPELRKDSRLCKERRVDSEHRRKRRFAWPKHDHSSLCQMYKDPLEIEIRYTKRDGCSAGWYGCIAESAYVESHVINLERIVFHDGSVLNAVRFKINSLGKDIRLASSTR